MNKPPFVGRERELVRLRSFLGQGLLGRGQVAFVTGEAGSGKTALLNAFTDEAQRQDEDLIVAVGSCNAQGRIGDPYLPFREVLGALTGTTDQHPRASGRLNRLLVHSAQVLVEVGPDLVNTLIPGSSLVAKIGKVAIEKVGWMDQLEKLTQKKRPANGTDQPALEQGRMFEQYANVLRAIAQKHTLLIVIDDLHWADEASISLFFHLSRRIETSRMLLVGTYRPDEIETAGGTRHPLEKVLSEIKRYAGDVWIDLGHAQETEKRAFVNRLLDSEPNQLGLDFREQVYQHTDGHPLFTVELLRSMQERGDLIKDPQGRWVIGHDLDWDTLPARVEGVIEERIGRLGPTEREILDIASVQGQTFTAEVVGQIVQIQMRQVLKALSQELERQHRLVQETGSLRAGRSLLASYQFAHTLFQHYLYERLGNAEKRLLHGEIAHVLEGLYTHQTDQVSPQLAWHYDQSGNTEQAITHLIHSGELANAQGAPQVARVSFTRALELLNMLSNPQQPVLEQPVLEQHWQALLGRHTALLRIGDAEALQADTDALIQLAEGWANPHKRAEAAYRKLLHTNYLGNASTVLMVADEAIAAARTAQAVTLEARSLHIKATTQVRLGETSAALDTATTALSCARETRDDTVLANALSGMATYHSNTGDLSQAVQFRLEALEVATRSASRVHQARILTNLGDDYRNLGLYDLAQTTLEQALHANERIGARRERAYVLNVLVATHLATGQAQTAHALLEPALTESHDINDQYLHAEFIKMRACVRESLGDLAGATQAFQEACQQFDTLHITPSALEATAGLARLALAQGETNQAQTHAQHLWDHLREHGMGSLFPEANLACAQVFRALGNPEAAREVIEGGYNNLIERSNTISNPDWRQSFLHNVPENKQLLHAWQQLQMLA